MKNVYSILLILALSSCATIAPTMAAAGPYRIDTITTDAMCSAVFTVVADAEDAKEDTNTRKLANYDALAFMISWEQKRLGVNVNFYNAFVIQYKKDMDSPTWLLHWIRCVTRANEIYPRYLESRK